MRGNPDAGEDDGSVCHLGRRYHRLKHVPGDEACAASSERVDRWATQFKLASFALGVLRESSAVGTDKGRGITLLTLWI